MFYLCTVVSEGIDWKQSLFVSHIIHFIISGNVSSYGGVVYLQ